MKTTKHTMHLRPGDMDYLKEVFPKTGASAVIRSTVSDLVDRLRNDEAEASPDTTEHLNLNLESPQP